MCRFDLRLRSTELARCTVVCAPFRDCQITINKSPSRHSRPNDFRPPPPHNETRQYLSPTLLPYFLLIPFGKSAAHSPPHAAQRSMSDCPDCECEFSKILPPGTPVRIMVLLPTIEKPLADFAPYTQSAFAPVVTARLMSPTQAKSARLTDFGICISPLNLARSVTSALTPGPEYLHSSLETTGTLQGLARFPRRCNQAVWRV